MNKKANILAAIIVGAVLLAAGAVMIAQVPPSNEKTDNQQRMTSESQTLMRQAIAVGLRDWMMNGFSDQNKVWYSTGALPPDFDEAKDGQYQIVNERVDEYMDRLHEENPDYFTSEDVDVNFEVELPLTDDHEMITAKVSGFLAGLKTPDLEQIENLSTTYEFPFKSWLMYDYLNEWLKTNADQITQKLHTDALMATSCQLVTGGCECAEAEFSEAAKESIRLKKEQILPVLEERVAALNSMFEGTGVKCGYEIKMMNIQNTEKTQWTIGDVGPNGTLVVKPRSEDYDYALEKWVQEARTRPGGDPCGGLPLARGEDPVPPNCTARDDLNILDRISEAYEEPDTTETCVGYVSKIEGFPNLDQTMKIGMLAMDKKLALLMTVYCEDPSTSVETLHGMAPLRSEIDMRIAIALDCPLPANAKDTYVDPEIYPGETTHACQGCFPDGTLITMADGQKRPIEKVAAGDSVKSFDLETNSVTAGVVQDTYSLIRSGIYEITFEDSTSMQVTEGHPFYTSKNGYIGWASIKNGALEAGDSVLDENQDWNLITDISYLSGDVQTYNLREVSGENNFFADGKLVHNKVCCFPAGTPITMADGSTKSIENIKIDDQVLTYDETSGNLESSAVQELHETIREGLYKLTFDNNKVLRLTNDHPLLTRDGWAAIDVYIATKAYALKEIKPLAVGSEVLQDDLTYARITGIDYIEGDVHTYTLRKVEKNRNFFANGFLAHNMKFIGLVCPIDCQTCYGCAPADGVANPRPEVPDDWQCVGPVPNLVCGKCGKCDFDGECTIPQDAGYPCFDVDSGSPDEDSYGDCWACNGAGTGNEACVLNPSSISNVVDVPCNDAVCAKCSGNGLASNAGGCVDTLDSDTTCNDMTIDEGQRKCMLCRAGVKGSCQPDLATNELCDTCTRCNNGVCDAPAPGNEAGCSDPCMKCGSVAGQCVVDIGMDACDKCEKCEGDGSCGPDTSKDFQKVGNCKECFGGTVRNLPDGTSCGSIDGCLAACKNGGCKVAPSAIGQNCGSNSCGIPKQCTAAGCELVDRGSFCCGNKECALGSECCESENACRICTGIT